MNEEEKLTQSEQADLQTDEIQPAEEQKPGISKREKIRFYIFIGVITVLTAVCAALAFLLPNYIKNRAVAAPDNTSAATSLTQESTLKPE